jgi:hypothetical protein
MIHGNPYGPDPDADDTAYRSPPQGPRQRVVQPSVRPAGRPQQRQPGMGDPYASVPPGYATPPVMATKRTKGIPWGDVVIDLGLSTAGLLMLLLSWRWTILGIDATFHWNLAEAQPSVLLPWGLGRFGVQDIPAAIISLIEWRLMPYTIKWKNQGGLRNKVQRRQDVTPVRYFVWAIVTGFSIGTSVAGVMAWLSTGITFPFLFFAIVLPTTGVVAGLIGTVLATAGDLLPEPLLRSSLRELGRALGLTK